MIPELAPQVLKLITTAGQATLTHFRSSLTIDNKAAPGEFDPVTQADRLAETIIRDGLTREYPDHHIVGEEFGGEIGDGMTWIIDPIDGTRSYMSGMLHWGILVGLYDNGVPVFGAMYQPFTDEFFIGDNTQAEYRRGTERRVLRVKSCSGLNDATLASTGPEFFSPPELHAFMRVQKASKQVRFGGDCYLYAMIAMGQMDLGVEAGLQIYDIAALIPIIRGAGGVITSWDGEDPSLGGRIVAAGDQRVHEQALKYLSSVPADEQDV